MGAPRLRFGRVLFLADDPARIAAQLAGRDLDAAEVGALRDDVSTDEISPLASMVHFDAALGRFAHTGFTVRGQRPIGVDALRDARIEVLVGGRRYGKGSSREHSPLAELSAGVRLVVAESFERIYRQNADNLGLLTSTDLGLVERIRRSEPIGLDELLAGRDAQAAASRHRLALAAQRRARLRRLRRRQHRHGERLRDRRGAAGAKDLALHLLALPAVRDGEHVGPVFEFGGAAIRALRTDERATLTNMTAEMGAFTGLVEPDDETRRFVRDRRGVDVAIEPWMRSDPGARYAGRIEVDATTLSPWVARPGDPGRGVALSELAELASRPRIDIAYGGSCTAGKRDDFEQMHAVLAWAAARGRRVAPGVRLYLQFGTVDVREHARRAGWFAAFDAVGAELLPPSCGACANCGPGASTAPEQVTVSAINRNFPGRSGSGQVWLASPAIVAASAIAGRLASFAELQAG